jgi:hypothetical protein
LSPPPKRFELEIIQILLELGMTVRRAKRRQRWKKEEKRQLYWNGNKKESRPVDLAKWMMTRTLTIEERWQKPQWNGREGTRKWRFFCSEILKKECNLTCRKGMTQFIMSAEIISVDYCMGRKRKININQRTMGLWGENMNWVMDVKSQALTEHWGRNY